MFGYHTCQPTFTMVGSYLLAPSLANYKQGQDTLLKILTDILKKVKTDNGINSKTIGT